MLGSTLVVFHRLTFYVTRKREVKRGRQDTSLGAVRPKRFGPFGYELTLLRDILRLLVRFCHLLSSIIVGYCKEDCQV